MLCRCLARLQSEVSVLQSKPLLFHNTRFRNKKNIKRCWELTIMGELYHRSLAEFEQIAIFCDL